MKKILRLAASAFVLIFSLALLFGCGNGGDTEISDSPPPAGTTDQTTDTNVEAPPVATGDLRVLNFLYPGMDTDHFEAHRDPETGALGQRLAAELGMELNMSFVGWGDYWNLKSVRIAARDPMDLTWDGTPNLARAVGRQETQPLDDLLERYGQDMLRAIPMDWIEGARVGGYIHGIPSAYAPASAPFMKITLRVDILEDVGMTLDDLQTPDDLMEFARRARDEFPHIRGAGDPIFKPLQRGFFDDSFLSVGVQSNMVMFIESTQEIVLYYDTDTFRQVAEFNRAMYDAGLYTDDVTILYNERDFRFRTGNYIWVEGSVGKEMEQAHLVRENEPDAVIDSIILGPQNPRYIIASGGEVLMIPPHADNPDLAMQFMNWMFSSPENHRLAILGVEGRDYNLVGDNRFEPLNDNEFFYEWMFRNINFMLFSTEFSDAQVDRFINWDNDAVFSDLLGFAFDNSDVLDLEAALIEADNDMLPIHSGFVDFDTNFPDALQALEDAGIREYMAEIERQVRAFLEETGRAR